MPGSGISRGMGLLYLLGDNLLPFTPYCVCSLSCQSGLKSLEDCAEGTRLGIWMDTRGHVRLRVDGSDMGPVATLPGTSAVYGLVDLYGKCEQVSFAPQDSQQVPAAAASASADQQLQSTTLMEQCEYFKMCQRFVRSLALPKHFVSSNDAAACFCTRY